MTKVSPKQLAAIIIQDAIESASCWQERHKGTCDALTKGQREEVENQVDKILEPFETRMHKLTKGYTIDDVESEKSFMME